MDQHTDGPVTGALNQGQGHDYSIYMGVTTFGMHMHVTGFGQLGWGLNIEFKHGLVGS